MGKSRSDGHIAIGGMASNHSRAHLWESVKYLAPLCTLYDGEYDDVQYFRVLIDAQTKHYTWMSDEEHMQIILTAGVNIHLNPFLCLVFLPFFSILPSIPQLTQYT